MPPGCECGSTAHPCFLLCPSHPRAQGKPQQNRKLTDFYPVRRSSRKSKAELQVASAALVLALGGQDGSFLGVVLGQAACVASAFSLA